MTTCSNFGNLPRAIDDPSSAETQKLSLELALVFLRRRLPQKVLYNILRQWTSQQRLFVDRLENGYRLHYHCDTDAVGEELSGALREEYILYRRHSFLEDAKYFDTPECFYLSHLLLAPHASSNTPKDSPAWSKLTAITPTFGAIAHPMQQDCTPHLHGLKKIILDFSAEQYFALFNVLVPPFDNPEYNNVDPLLSGAASFLASTEDFTLHFGTNYKSANAWQRLRSCSRWTEQRYPGYDNAKSRPDVCDSGVVVDWILEYAWEGCYLQHIRKIRITGEVQEWVKDKWHAIFEDQARFNQDNSGMEMAEKNFAVHDPDTDAIERTGMALDEHEMHSANDTLYRAEDHFPPMCECEIACSELSPKEILDDTSTQPCAAGGGKSEEAGASPVTIVDKIMTTLNGMKLLVRRG